MKGLNLSMTAKYKQTEFIKSYLKPTLKLDGFKTDGLTWWKDKGDFFIVINLQNYSWNSKNSIDFRFNIGIAVTKLLKDPEKKKATYNDLVVNVGEAGHLPKDRIYHKYKNNVGYSITDDTDLADFIQEFSIDLEKEILPSLNKMGSLKNCLDYYKQFTFWGDNLLRIIQQDTIVS